MELISVGLVAGVIAGFFGVGGGLVSVPLLLYIGINIKGAIGISVTQMVFSSIFGTAKNIKKGDFKLKKYYPFGVGAIFGSFGGANLMHLLPDKVIGFVLVFLILFAFVRIWLSKTKEYENTKNIPFIVAFFVGAFIGIISGMLGIGGSVILIPVLVGFFHYSTKESSKIALFFVVFSSVSAFLTLFMLGYIDFSKALIVAFASLFGVQIGHFLLHKSHIKTHRRWTLTLYGLLFILTLNKVLNG